MDIQKFKASDIIPKIPRTAKEYELKYYDFRRPDKFSMEQIRTISGIYETFSRLSSVSLSAKLKKQVDMHVVSVDQLTYAEFLPSLDSPTIMGIVNYDPLICSTLMEMSPGITESICDILYGGNGETAPLDHELSFLGRSLIDLVWNELMGNLREAWKNVFDIKPELKQLEHNPQFAQIVPPGEMIVLVTLNAVIGDKKGHLQFCIPYLTLEPLLQRLSAKWHYNRPSKENSPEMIRKIGSLKLESSVLCRGEQMSLKSLGQLKKGSLIAIPDYKKGKGILRMGDEKLLKVRFKKNRRTLELTLPTSGSDRNLSFSEMKKMRDEPADMLEKKIEGLTNIIERSINELNRKIDDVSSSQDHLNDHLFLDNPDPSKTSDVGSSLEFIKSTDLSNLHLILINDFPQLAALILSRIDNELSASLLSFFNENAQGDLIRRISSIGRVSQDILLLISGVLEQKLMMMNQNTEPEREGLLIAASILNNSGRELERKLLDRLEKEDKGLTDKLKSKMFVFEDITMLSDHSFETLVNRVDPGDLSLAMKIIDESVRMLIMERLDTEMQKTIQKLIDNSGRLKISDIDEAERRIIALIRDMETEGEIELKDLKS